MGIATMVRSGVRAARVASASRAVRQADDAAARHEARARLADLLGAGDGIPAKLAQWLASGADGVDFAASLTRRSAAPWSRVWPAVRADLGAAAERLDRVGAGTAASLGQVHRAIMDDGREVAIKVHLPGIQDAIAADLRLFDLLPGVGPVKRHGIDLNAYRRRIRRTLEHELDYAAEASTQIAYRVGIGPDEGIIVPEVIASLSGPTVLTQQWEESEPLASAMHWPEVVRRTLAERLVRHVLRQVFGRGMVHADLHSGNVGFRQDGSLVLYDFGCVAEVPPITADGIRALLSALRRGADTATLCQHLAEAGFDLGKLRLCGESLAPALRCAFAPLITAGPFSCRDWRPAEQLAELLGDARWWFRAAGPESLFLPMRTYAGLIRLVARLEVAIDWSALLPEPPSGQRGDASGSASLSATSGQGAASGQGTCLRIRVRRSNVTTADIRMPAAALDGVETLLGDALLARLRLQGIDPRAVADEARRRGWPAGDLFTDRNDSRHIRVWLEAT